MNKTIVPIRGMHCRSCEILIEEKLKELPEIKSVQINYKKKQAIIYSKGELDLNTVKLSIEEAGYEVGGDDSKNWISRDLTVYKDILISLMILLGIYFWFRILNISGFGGGNVSNPSNLFVVLMIGLTAGISTCMALVGGLVLGISARYSEKHPEASPTQKFRPHIFFNIGRVVSFFIFGGLIGLIGNVFQLNGLALGIMTIAVGIIMLALGLQLTELFPKLSNGGITLPSGISKFLGIKKHHVKEYSHWNSALVGALTFFLPCGFTQAMQVYAISTGNLWSGALIMAIFAIGTTPGLLSIGGLTSFMKGSFAKKIFKFVGVVVVILALFNINNGYNLTGWKIGFSESNISSSADPNVTIENGVQVVRMTQVSNGYKPNKVTIQKGMPVKWIIKATDLNSCSSSILVSKLNIKKYLTIGDNIFEFTPKETGEIKFTCAMGMYPSKFIVIEDGK